MEAMASCTEVTYVKGLLVGDPLDVKMFESTGWLLDEDSQTNEDVILANVYPPASKIKFSSQILRRFEFSSKLQRMSCICRNICDGKYRAFVKGSPEMLSTLCKKESLPSNFNQVLDKYT